MLLESYYHAIQYSDMMRITKYSNNLKVDGIYYITDALYE